MDPVTFLLTALLTGAPVVTEDDLTLPDGCRPAQAAQTVQAFVGPAVHFDEVIVGYANSVGQLEFSATINGRRAHGKGAMDCAARSVVAFGIGPEDDHPTARLCPPARTHATVACVRHWR